MAPGMQNFVAIGSGVSVPKNTWFFRAFGVTSFLFVFWVLQLGFFTQNTSNDVFPGKEVPFGGPDDYILYLDP